MVGPNFNTIFPSGKPLIAVIHLMPLPGSPGYNGDRNSIYERALDEVRIFTRQRVDALLIENYRDRPFYPRRLPAETIASLSAVGKQIIGEFDIPVGINALRNDAESALAIATAIGAQFIRVNVHMGAVLAGEGLIEGRSHNTLRLKKRLRSNVLIFADVGVKHAKPVVDRGLAAETKDLTDRGGVDALIATGERTGAETKLDDLRSIKANTSLPVLVGSGINPDNIARYYAEADGFIVGSYFKTGGEADNFVDEKRVEKLMDQFDLIRR